ncbi:hypothetical protein DFJ63DRAFT_321766 [Scheffersomyces coipomensis]|uniref:uncharacterized protein n=1 Tax=Scheffersomyces coipomensis TaxID=1788519 RepID=UPI00315CA6C9
MSSSLSSISTIVKYLDNDKKKELALNLSLELKKSPENTKAICGLLEDIEVDPTSELYQNLSNYSNAVLFDDESVDGSQFSDVLELINVFPLLRDDLLSKIEQHLTSYITKFKYNFQPEIFNIIKLQLTKASDENLSTEFILKLFQFLDSLFIHVNTSLPKSIDAILLTFIANNDDDISSIVSKLLRWRIQAISDSFRGSSTIWDLIFMLINTGIKTHKTHAYIFWLRYLSHEDLLSNDEFKAITKTSNYWKDIQTALVSDSHEHRKYCLSILQLTVKAVHHDIENEYITWKNSQREKHLHEWSRFVTLFEILGIDTSLHQAEGGETDITSLISSNSLINPSWGFCLLSTGFKASMDSVRKFALKLLFSIPESELYLLKYGLEYLEDIFLPYSMLAAHFSVRSIDQVEDCYYGKKLASFISNIIISLDDNDTSTVVYALFKALGHLKDAFDPSRIYVTLGIYRGLTGKKALKFGKHDESLVKLFETNAEGELFETTIQTLNLRILLHFDISNSISTFFDCLQKFIKFNGYAVYQDNISLFQEYFADKKQSLEEYLKSSHDDEINILILSILQNEALINDNASDLLLAKVSESGLKVDFDINKLFSKVTASDDLKFVQSLSNSKTFIAADDSTLVNLWNTIKTGFLSDDYHVLELTYYKYKVFNGQFKVSDYEISLQDLIEFNNNLLINSKEIPKIIKSFYKLKDEIYGEYYASLNIAMKKSSSSSTVDADQLLDLLDSTSSSFHANLSTVQLLQNYIINDTLSIPHATIERIVHILCDIWRSLDATRLQLNQKDLQLLLIETIFSPIILHQSISNEDISDELCEFAMSVIKNSQGRKSLLPKLTKCISNYQTLHTSNFEKLEWIAHVLIEAFIVYQLTNSSFRLELVIGKLFDQDISLHKDSQIYGKVYGPEEISAKINLMAIFNSIKSETFALGVFKYIYDNQSDYYLFQVYKSTDGFEEWRRIQLFTIVLSIIDKFDFSPYLSRFIELIATDPSPLARAYIEWIISYQLLNNESKRDEVMESLASGTLKPAVINSYSRILFLSIQQVSDKVIKSKLISKLITLLITSATSNKVIIRHFSLSLLISVYAEIHTEELKVEEGLLDTIDKLYAAASQSESFGQYRSGDALLWNIKKDLNLVSMSGGILLRISDRDTIDFISYQDYEKYLSDDQKTILDRDIGNNFENLWVRERNAKQRGLGKADASTQSPLQTKSGQWGALMDVDEETIRGKEVVRSDLIVVSSLVDKPPNLGGICRLSDVLGAGLLTLNDIHVKNHPQFKTVAVTADHWMPMEEVKEKDIRDFLQLKKKEGYTLIGLEQTDKSIELNSDLKFPAKSLILLGKEKEGIPGELLAELDFCVEIKQVGVIRSMNIQTAAAIIVHAYSVQHN